MNELHSPDKYGYALEFISEDVREKVITILTEYPFHFYGRKSGPLWWAWYTKGATGIDILNRLKDEGLITCWVEDRPMKITF